MQVLKQQPQVQQVSKVHAWDKAFYSRHYYGRIILQHCYSYRLWRYDDIINPL